MGNPFSAGIVSKNFIPKKEKVNCIIFISIWFYLLGLPPFDRISAGGFYGIDKATKFRMVSLGSGFLLHK
jgi:hypothetical protein